MYELVHVVPAGLARCRSGWTDAGLEPLEEAAPPFTLSRTFDSP
jgi:hypothetical protein